MRYLSPDVRSIVEVHSQKGDNMPNGWNLSVAIKWS